MVNTPVGVRSSPASEAPSEATFDMIRALISKADTITEPGYDDLKQHAQISQLVRLLTTACIAPIPTAGAVGPSAEVRSQVNTILPIFSNKLLHSFPGALLHRAEDEDESLAEFLVPRLLAAAAALGTVAPSARDEAQPDTPTAYELRARLLSVFDGTLAMLGGELAQGDKEKSNKEDEKEKAREADKKQRDKPDENKSKGLLALQSIVQELVKAIKDLHPALSPRFQSHEPPSLPLPFASRTLILFGTEQSSPLQDSQETPARPTLTTPTPLALASLTGALLHPLIRVITPSRLVPLLSDHARFVVSAFIATWPSPCASSRTGALFGAPRSRDAERAAWLQLEAERVALGRCLLGSPVLAADDRVALALMRVVVRRLEEGPKAETAPLDAALEVALLHMIKNRRIIGAAPWVEAARVGPAAVELLLAQTDNGEDGMEIDGQPPVSDSMKNLAAHLLHLLLAPATSRAPVRALPPATLSHLSSNLLSADSASYTPAERQLVSVLRGISGGRKRKRGVDEPPEPFEPISADEEPVVPENVKRRETVARVLSEWWGVDADQAQQLAAQDAAGIPWSQIALATVPEADPFRFAVGLGLLAPALAGTLTFPDPSERVPHPIPRCTLCDSTSAPSVREPVASSATVKLWAAVAPSLSLEARVQTAAFDSLRKMLVHASDADASVPWGPAGRGQVGEMVENALEGPVRSLRLAAGRAASLILQAQQRRVGAPNPVALFTCLDKLLDRGSLPVKETTLVVVGALGRIANDRVLPRVLTCLLSQLGQSNPLLRGLAYTKLEALAESRHQAVYKLFSPFLPEISFFLVSNMLSAPNMLTEALQLMGVSNETDFIVQTLEHTVPALIAAGKLDELAAVANVAQINLHALCLEHVDRILAHLYLRPDGRRDVGLRAFLEAFKGSRKSIDLASIIISSGEKLLARLVLELGDEDQRMVSTAIESLDSVERTVLAAAKGSSASAKTAQSQLISGSLLKNHILGVMSHMSDILNGVQGKRSIEDRKKVIRALSALIERVGPGISTVSPQLMALLQGTLEVDALREVSLRSLHSFIVTPSFKEIGPFVGRISATYVGIWSSFTPAEQRVAHGTLDYLLSNASELGSYVDDIVDLDGIKELEPVNMRLKAIRKDWSFPQRIDNLLSRVGNENARVRLQSLWELNKYLESLRSRIHALVTGDMFDPVVSRIIKTVLAAAARSGDLHEEVQNAAFKCVGILGALDPDRLDLDVDDSVMVVLKNFEDQEEAVEFVVHVLEAELVGAYRSTNDSHAQQGLAFAIQELLKFCGFKPSLLQPTSAGSSSSSGSVSLKIRHRWQKFPKVVLETLSTLLVEGRYHLSVPKAKHVEHPVYPSSATYSEWLRTWSFDLIHKVTGDRAKAIFGVFKPVVRNQDVGVARHILPYLVVNVLLGGTDTDRDELVSEILAILSDQVKPKGDLSQDRRLLCAQTVFDLMDYISKWTRQCRTHLQSLQKAAAAARRSDRKAAPPPPSPELAACSEQLARVVSLMSSIDPDLLARAALKCQAYARSLLNFEQRLVELRSKGVQSDTQSYYEHLHEIYAQLDEPDGMEGVSTKIISPSLEHQIREHESTGRWTSAQSCWEVELQKRPDDLTLHTGLLRCLRNLGHYDTLGTHIRGVLGRHPEWEAALGPFAIEGAWIVGDWDTVQDILSRAAADGPEYAIARVLISMREGLRHELPEALRLARQQLGVPIVAAGKDGFRRAYGSVVHLHMLHELDMIAQAIAAVARNKGSDRVVSQLATNLFARLSATMPSFKSREPIVSLRRSALAIDAQTQAWLRPEIGRLWLSSAKIARKAGHYQTAYSATLQATQCDAPFAFVQSAKLLKASGQAQRALQELDVALQFAVPKTGAQAVKSAGSIRSAGSSVVDLTEENDGDALVERAHAKAVLLRARWCAEGERYSHNEIIKGFTEASNMADKWEHPHYELGHYYDERSKSQSGQADVMLTYLTCKCYARALQYGTKYIYRAMPRMLTLWLDFGARPQLVKQEETRQKPNAKSDKVLYETWTVYDRLNKVINKAIERLPAYQWYIAFAQVVSRIGHPNEVVYGYLERIMSTVLQKHPHQALWAMVGMANSTKPKRAERCKNIMTRVSNGHNSSSAVRKAIREALALTDELLAMCNKKVEGDEYHLSMSRTFPKLSALAPMSLVLPLQSSMTVTLPSTSEGMSQHNPFPDRPVSIAKFLDEVELMRSLVKPRKITIVGDNGKAYSFLCKPDDDLRKDARLMDFNAMINKLLKSNSEARKRSLHIRTYTVVPLNERCGLIEWVNDTKTLRSILIERYDLRNIRWYTGDIQTFLDAARNDSPERVAQVFSEKILSRYPPVFHEWFLETFPEPTAWLASRTVYGRTAAVMSMVGFILGLGDRHGENILLDRNTGAVQHVDFNCLFEKGKTFEVAEKVPFRLSQNLVDGLGVTGVDGVFRKAAEVTMEVLRTNKDSLMSVLETFLHDPVVDWEDERRRKERDRQRQQAIKSKAVRGRTSNAMGDEDEEGQAFIKDLAMKALSPIELKLKGLQTTHAGTHVEKEVAPADQVESLIREATSPANLGSMYVGWAAWL